MIQSRRNFVISLFILIWIMVILILYYKGHKPFTPTQILQLGKAIGQLGLTMGVISIAGGLGLRLLPLREVNPLASLSLQASIGFGLLGIGVLIFGSTVGINALFVLASVLILAVLLRREVIQWIRSWSEIYSIWNKSGRFGKLICIGIGLFIFVALAVALAPPIKFDALIYHLTLPQTYLQSGKIIYLPDSVLWGMPQLVEMLYTLMMAVGGIESATVLGWAVGTLSVIGLIGYTFQCLGMRAAWVAAASLITGYSLASSLSWGYVEWFTILYGFGLVVMLDVWRKVGSRKYLFFAGLISGIALGVKYTAGILIIAGIIVVFVQSIKKENHTGSVIINLLLYSLPVLLSSLPWWIKNAAATGNPFYPFFFPAGAMDHFRLEFSQLPPWGDWRDILLLPWQATIYGIDGASGYSTSVGPLLLALSPLSLLGWSRRDVVQRQILSTAAIISIVGIVVWVMASRFSGYLIQSRFYFSIFPAIAILAGAGFDSLASVRWASIRLGRVVGVIILMVMCFSLYNVGGEFLTQGALKVVLGLRTTQQYIEDNLGWYQPVMQAIRELPDDKLVLMLWEPRSLYCVPKCLSDETLDRWIHDYHLYKDSSKILESWRDLGYSHILYFKFGAEYVRQDDSRYSPTDWKILEDLLEQLPAPINFGNAYYLYSIKQ